MPGRPLTAGDEDRVPGAAGLHRPDRHRGRLQRLAVLFVLHEHSGRLDRDVVEGRAGDPACRRREDDVRAVDSLAGQQVVSMVEEPAADPVDPQQLQRRAAAQAGVQRSARMLPIGASGTSGP